MMRKCYGGPADGLWLEGDAPILRWLTPRLYGFDLGPDSLDGESPQPAYDVAIYQFVAYQGALGVLYGYRYAGIEQR